MIEDVMLKRVVSQLAGLINKEIDRARDEDRDEDYDMLIDSYYSLNEIYACLREVIKK